MRCQFGTSNSEKKGLRYKFLAFTEQGVAMLSSILQSKRAVQVNIHIMRAFIQLRQMLLTHADLKKKIEAMEKKYDEHNFGSYSKQSLSALKRTRSRKRKLVILKKVRPNTEKAAGKIEY